MEYLEYDFTEEYVNNLSPTVWAYVGDAVYELFIRTYLVKVSHEKSGKLHSLAIDYVKAGAQAEKLREITDILTEKEKDIVRRTRNIKTHMPPKSAEFMDYKYATAYVGLIGYLFLTKQYERLKYLLDKVIK